MHDNTEEVVLLGWSIRMRHNKSYSHLDYQQYSHYIAVLQRFKRFIGDHVPGFLQQGEVRLKHTQT
jgi:hypothetical protein